jgi:carbonic anhydrase/acetyltransferase-like protein (isoleucine patch superfamily)
MTEIQGQVEGQGAKRRPSNVLSTIRRLLPACLLLPFQLLRHGRDGLNFRHPLSTVSGRVFFGRYSEVGSHVSLNSGSAGIRIGQVSQINALTSIVGNVLIGDRVLIAPSCTLAAGGHPFGKAIQRRFSGGSRAQTIRIEDDVWLGAWVLAVGAVVAAGVKFDRDAPPATLVRRGLSLVVFEALR